MRFYLKQCQWRIQGDALPSPDGTQFVHFCIRFHRKAPVSKIGAPTNGKSWIRHCKMWYILMKSLKEDMYELGISHKGFSFITVKINVI